MYGSKTPVRKTALIQRSEPPIILHVTESFGGGVATALAQYVRSTPELSHHLLMGVREGDFSDSGELALFESVETLPNNAVAAVRSIRNRYKCLRPDIIHAHSSFAGAYVRMAKKATKNCRIVYTPHGYSFERKDITKLHNYIFRITEGILALNTTVTAACSPRERELTKGLNKSLPTVYVPNVAASSPKDASAPTASMTGFTIAAVGRLTAARDPLFFRDTVRILHDHHADIEAVWIGGGDALLVRELENVGVRVTGWLDRQRVALELSSAGLHIHTAAWDAFPMVLLEANEQRIPSLVRPIDAFSHLDKVLTAETPREMALKIMFLAADQTERATLLERWDMSLSDNTSQVQQMRLRTAYEVTP